MKFRTKISLCIVCLMSLIFGAAGSLLIYGSFQRMAGNEREAALRACSLLVNTLSVSPSADIVPVILTQLTSYDSAWSGVALLRGSDTVYQSGSAPKAGNIRDGMVSVAAEDESYILCCSFDAAGEEYTLCLRYDISSLYKMRGEMQSVYAVIFVVMLVVCAGASYLCAWLLTRPLGILAFKAREISKGNYSVRSKVRSHDEIGVVSREFDKMAAKIEENIKELNEAVLRQERFVGSFTHELKTPMTSIMGYADLLRGGELSDEESVSALNYIYSEGKRLERLSMKLLELFTAEKTELKTVSAAPCDIITDITSHLAGEYARRGLTLTCGCEEGTCLLEPDLFRTVVTNLLDNAAKAFDGGEGKIRISLRMTDTGCAVSVTDNGRGIPESSLDKLTEAFYRVDKSRSRAMGGAGLGLALCVRIVKLHGGSLRFDSVEGIGTRVTAEFCAGRELCRKK